tara:strand:- start:949 stop:1176 length:228 start_codon:yes stop_codon:yes gene_type:complete
MSKKKYVLSTRPTMARPNEAGCVEVTNNSMVEKPSDYNLSFYFVKQLDPDTVKPSKITSAERKRILAQENASIRR